MATKSQRLAFPGSSGADLAARLDLPDGPVRAYVLFAHCFTCSKDVLAARRIADGLARRGFAVLRFDFTGLGSSQGDFGSTNFSSNVGDLLSAVDHLRQNYQAPAVLIGHSLGGAAILSVAAEVPEAKAVVAIAAPADAAHVVKNFHAHLDQIRESGKAEVTLGGRPFTIRKQFIDDLENHEVTKRVSVMRKPLMVLHSPIDATVGVENAAEIFAAAKHPKSYVSLDTADHLLTDPKDAAFAAEVISAWAARYVGASDETRQTVPHDGGVLVRETGDGKFQSTATARRHHLFVDEPATVGGDDSGPSPYDYLAIALGGCTAMTLRVYADRKGVDVGRISVRVDHGKVDADHCEDCDKVVAGKTGRIDRLERRIAIDGVLDRELRDKLLEIADKCPVHRTLKSDVAIVTEMVD